jgi:dihydrofolate reductase
VTRQVILWNLVTLDGYFEGVNPWDIEWHGSAWGEELDRLSTDQLHAADTLLFGRVTYQGMAGYWPTATDHIAALMNGIHKVVFSRTFANADWNNTRLVSTDAADEVARLKAQPGKDMLIFGSATLAASLMGRGLIDEYRIGIAPIVLGGGTPLFKPSPAQLRMQLLEARPLKSGGVLLRYRPAGNTADAK